jgi:hypothetical protein
VSGKPPPPQQRVEPVWVGGAGGRSGAGLGPGGDPAAKRHTSGEKGAVGAQSARGEQTAARGKKSLAVALSGLCPGRSGCGLTCEEEGLLLRAVPRAAQLRVHVLQRAVVDGVVHDGRKASKREKGGFGRGLLQGVRCAGVQGPGAGVVLAMARTRARTARVQGRYAHGQDHELEVFMTHVRLLTRRSGYFLTPYA